MSKQSTLDEMLLSVNRLRERIARDRSTLAELMPRIELLQNRERLSKLVGVADGATISFGASTASLRGKSCTVLKVNRTRATVDVRGEQWDFPFEFLHADEITAEMERAANRSLGAGQ